MSEITVSIPRKIGWSVVVSVVVGAFGAGCTWILWSSQHPSRGEIATMLAPLSLDAKAAKDEAFHCTQEIRALRSDLARGFGRALTPKIVGRDEAGKAALRQYEREVAQGVPSDVAMRHVLEGDY